MSNIYEYNLAMEEIAQEEVWQKNNALTEEDLEVLYQALVANCMELEQ